MNNWAFGHAIRGILILLLQGLVLQRIFIGGSSFNYFMLMIYPVIILLLPIKISRMLLVVIGFGVGLFVDVFYGSLGVHAAAALFIAFVRPYVLQVLEPRGGYPVSVSPSPADLGTAWFLRYAAIMLALFMVFYFSAEVFTFTLIGQILVKSISSFVLSYLAIVAYVLLFNPK